MSDPRSEQAGPEAQAADKGLPVGAHRDFSRDMSYGDYLQLDQLLSAQKPLTDQHDELLFVIIHQTTELWMKLMIHELKAAVVAVRSDDLRPAFKMLSRVARIQSELIQAWDILSTMTPADYLQFRDALGHSSGFQSHQYREIEFLLGNKRASFLAPFAHHPDLSARLEATLAAPSLYEEVLILLKKRGFDLDPDVTERNWQEIRDRNASVAAAWLEIYRDTQKHWDLYELAEKLIDLEDAFQQWRFRHLKTVTRIIGQKRGTGGTAGVDYLSKALSYCFFPEIWDIRTEL
ncbi:tryptophan 2,3-dioxygenase [Rhodovibrionaceae bacterium A322]